MAQLKSNLGVERKYEAFYTRGKIQVTKDGEHMFCGCDNKIQVVSIKSGQVESSIGQEEDEEISGFCLTPDNEFVVLATQNLLLRQWAWKDKKLIRTWKAIHTAPMTAMCFDPTSTLLATGSADSTVKLWDIIRQHCTHNLKGHQGIISVIEFHPDIEKLQLFSAGEDYSVRVWDLSTSSCVKVVEAHVSTVTSLCFSQDGSVMYSGCRDSTVSVWNLDSLEVEKTFPVFESIESVILLPENTDIPDVDHKLPHVITAGSKGVLRIWDAKKFKCVSVKNIGNVKDHGIIQAFHSPAIDALVVVTFDRNISIYNVGDLSLEKQFCGYTDEVLDLQFIGENDSHIVMATNSEHLKVFEVDTWDCQILQGHSDIILSVAVQKKHNLIATSSKDNSVRIWRLDKDSGQVTCVGKGQGHTHAVGCVIFSCLSPKMLVSGGQDRTLKTWSLPTFSSDEIVTFHSVSTEIAHEKDINSVAVAPNDKFIATGSQDKVIKLWSMDDLSLLGVMRGHKRGVWCVQFSPVDQCIASSSADGTIKIWGLSDYSCVKTFEGHDSSVLRVLFITRGMQLLSCGSDGLLKLWSIKSNECIKTFDEHEDTIWALASSKQEDKIITGGADSRVISWKDVTQEELDEARTKREDFILQEQKLSNLIQQKKFLKAIGLAITLEQPFRVLKIMKEILTEEDGKEKLQSTLEKLRFDQIDAVLRFSVHWNTNSRHSQEAQLVINTVLKSYTLEELQKFPNIKSTMEGLLPYTERHYKRLSRLMQQATFIEYTYQSMRVVADNPSTSHSLSVEKEKETYSVDNLDESDDEETSPVDNVDESDEEIDDQAMDVIEKSLKTEQSHPADKENNNYQTKTTTVLQKKEALIEKKKNKHKKMKEKSLKDPEMKLLVNTKKKQQDRDESQKKSKQKLVHSEKAAKSKKHTKELVKSKSKKTKRKTLKESKHVKKKR